MPVSSPLAWQASKEVGVFGFKRQVCSSSDSCSNFKTSYCIDCSETSFSYTSDVALATNTQHSQFINNCATTAFKSGGGVKSAYSCSDADMKLAKFTINMT